MGEGHSLTDHGHVSRKNLSSKKQPFLALVTTPAAVIVHHMLKYSFEVKIFEELPTQYPAVRLKFSFQWSYSGLYMV